jgi:LmbE family N-acetylglucosaminyl deacetylase
MWMMLAQGINVAARVDGTQQKQLREGLRLFAVASAELEQMRSEQHPRLAQYRAQERQRVSEKLGAPRAYSLDERDPDKLLLLIKAQVEALTRDSDRAIYQILSEAQKPLCRNSNRPDATQPADGDTIHAIMLIYLDIVQNTADEPLRHHLSPSVQGGDSTPLSILELEEEYQLVRAARDRIQAVIQIARSRRKDVVRTYKAAERLQHELQLTRRAHIEMMRYEFIAQGGEAMRDLVVAMRRNAWYVEDVEQCIIIAYSHGLICDEQLTSLLAQLSRIAMRLQVLAPFLVRWTRGAP